MDSNYTKPAQTMEDNSDPSDPKGVKYLVFQFLNDKIHNYVKNNYELYHSKIKN